MMVWNNENRVAQGAPDHDAQDKDIQALDQDTQVQNTDAQDTNLTKMRKTKIRKTKISLHPFITFRQYTTKKEEEVGDNEDRRSRR